MKLRIAGLEANHKDSGPGVRTELFVYGCLKECPSCQNKWTEDMPFLEVGTFKLALKIVRIGNPNISISGGEPLEQVLSVIELLKHVRRLNWLRFKRTNVLLYTGWTQQQINFFRIFRNNYFEDLMANIDYFVTEPWDERKKYEIVEDTCVGSWNQKAYLVIHKKPAILRELTVDRFGRLDVYDY